MRFPVLALCLAACAAPATAQQPPRQPGLGERTQSPEALFREMSAETPEQEMARLVAAANAYPLGTIENPVRVGGPEGERAYLARLTCQDGTPLRIGTRSEAGQGAFGAIANAYAVSCGGTTRRIVFDMYHAEHAENRAPSGFAIRP
ncbi:hypothetical protein [Sphingosinicella sp.]|uniref:hypothetical protein n=1 Tax=Sphingosinicella sp. TaxID=1917971 RepID=UPI0040383249